MRKYLKPLMIAVSLTLTLMCASTSYSQTSTNSTPQATATSDRAKLISLCENAKDEVITSRLLIGSYEATIKAQEKEQTLSDAELAKVREALDHEKASLAQSELAVTTYKKALSKEVKKKNFYKRVAEGLFITTAALAAVVVLSAHK